MKTELIINASRKASNFLIRDFNEISYLKNSTLKIQQFLQKSKTRTEEILLIELQKYFPDHEIINYGTNQTKPLDSSYIAFHPLEGQCNMQNLLPFFAITILVSTIKNGKKTQSAVINFPCLDKICYTSTAQDVLIEDYQHSFKKKATISENNTLTSICEFEQGLIELIKAQNIDLNSIRSVGSSSYALFLLANSCAKQCILKRQDWLHQAIADLIIARYNGSKQEIADYTIYGAKKATNNKILRFCVKE